MFFCSYFAQATYTFKCSPKDVPGYPFITGDAFRAIAHFVLDCDNTFDPTMVKQPSIIFVTTNYLKKFFRNFHPKISARYVLITHNYTDDPIPVMARINDFTIYLSQPKLIHWFGKNTCLRHPKLTTLPIGPRLGTYARDYYQNDINCAQQPGFHDSFCFIQQAFETFLAAYSSRNENKKYLAYLNIRTHTHPVRDTIYDLFNSKAYVYNCSRCGFKEYLQHLKESYFVFSPPGFGIDSHRTWEALALGCIPIVQSSPIDHIFEGLPVLIVKNWSDINQQMLEEYLTIHHHDNFNNQKLFLDYWFDLILQKLNS